MANREIEIHDSRLESLQVAGGQVVLNFSAAYIHQSDGRPGIDAGSGWTQRVIVRVLGDVVDGSLGELPCRLSTGHLVLHGSRSDNSILIPLATDVDVELWLTSEFGESVGIRGNRIELELLGEPKYIEEFPGAN